MRHLIVNSLATVAIFVGSFFVLSDDSYAGRNPNECCAGSGACCTCYGPCGANAQNCWCN